MDSDNINDLISSVQTKTTSVNNGTLSMPVIVQGDVFTRLVEAQRRTRKKLSTHLKNFTAVSGGPQGAPIENFVYGEETDMPLPIDNLEKIIDDENDSVADGNVVTFHERENFDVQQNDLSEKKKFVSNNTPSADLIKKTASSLYTVINKKPVDNLIEFLNARNFKKFNQSDLRL